MALPSEVRAADAADVDRMDLRLVPPAFSAWSAAAGMQAPWTAARVVLCCGLVILAAGAALPGGRRRAAGHPDGGRVRRPARRWPARRTVAAGCLACGVAAASIAWVRSAGLTEGFVHDLALRRGWVEIQAVVTGDPRISPGRVVGIRRSSDDVIVPARVERIRADGRTWQVRQPVLLLATSAGWQSLLPSQHVRASGRLQPARGGDRYAAVVLIRGPPAARGRPSTAQRIAGRLRAGLRSASSGLPPAERGLLPGLVDGDTSGLPAEVTDNFRATGLTHLTAVSGSNCAIVMGVVVALVGRTRLGRRSRALGAAAALLGFVVLARPSASVLRAAVMGLLGVAAAASGRPRAAMPGLAAAVLVLVLVDPSLAVSAGFALSVLATAGLLVLAPGWRDALARRIPARLAEVVAVPMAAQVACAPVIAWIAGAVSLVAVPANILAVPAVPPATVLGVVAAVVSPVCPPAARWCARLAGFACSWLLAVARIGAHAPGAQVGWVDGLPGALTLSLLSLIVVAAVRRRRSRRLLLAAAVGVVLAQALFVPVFGRRWPPPGWDFAVCDVGQGDALVLHAGGDRGVLVDAGPDPPALARCLRGLGIRKVPLVMLTHLHADHVEGLSAVLGHLAVGEIEVGPLFEPPEEWDRVRHWAAAARVPVTQARIGEERSVAGVDWQVLGPRTVLHGTDSDPNNDSLILRVRTGGLTILLSGDAEPPEQRELVGDPRLAADVLKVPHHGSANQDPAFLAAVGAQVAVVSVGVGNSYGHPSARTIATLRGLGARTFRTDEDGTLTLLRRNGVISVVPQHRHRTVVPAPAGARRGR